MIRKGEFLFLDGERALCLSCADFDHLEYLPRGDAALTRRAKKYSGLSAVVVRFSRSRGRYAPDSVASTDRGLKGDATRHPSFLFEELLIGKASKR